MSKRKTISDDDEPTPEIMEKKIKEKNELSAENKMIVLQTLMPNAHELFEKFNPNFDKRKARRVWDEAISELIEYGIVFKDWFKLKETVRNWSGRAIKKADALNKHGGSPRQLTEFEYQCLSFVRACKDNGSSSVDLSQCIETADTDAERNNDDTDAERNNDDTDAEQIIDDTESEKSFHQEQNQMLQILIDGNGDFPSTATISTSANITNTNVSTNVQDWKKKYFKSAEDIEKARVETQTMESDSNRYLLFLKTTVLEQQLGLNEMAIRKIRKSIASKVPIDKMPVILKPPSVFLSYDQETANNSNSSGLAGLPHDAPQ